VVTLATGDGEARSLFGEKSIGDTDGDGAPEFLDGWGRPINFLRWAPGFDSLVEINANTLPGIPPVDVGDNPDWEKAASGDHDPFDVFRVDPAAFRLIPLVYSAGRDEEYGIHRAEEYVAFQGLLQTQLNSVPHPNTWPPIRPCEKVGSPSAVYLGTDESTIDVNVDPTATDNVHNHLLGLR
jgi:hypothetical protein